MKEKDSQRDKGMGFVYHGTGDLLKALQFQSKLHVENIYLDTLFLGPEVPE